MVAGRAGRATAPPVPRVGPIEWSATALRPCISRPSDRMPRSGRIRRAIVRTGTTMPRMTEIGTDWRVVDGVATAWFDAPSLIQGAALAGRIVELSAEIVIDLRATGVRVRLDSDEHAEAVSAAARDLGVGPHPAVLEHLAGRCESGHA